MIWTIDRIIQNFKTARGVKFSRKTIKHFADEIGYKIKHSGGLIGYDKSLYTALTQRFPEMVKYENAMSIKKAQKASKREIEYNPDKFIEPEGRVDYEWEKNECRSMKQIIRLTETELRSVIRESVKIILENSTNEISHIANNSHITICSLEDFIGIVKSLGINDSNVEDFSGQYCFIEIGSGLERLRNEIPVRNNAFKDENGNVVDADDFITKQFYFSEDHSNVLRLIFDDNRKFGENGKKTSAVIPGRELNDIGKNPKANGLPGKINNRGGYKFEYNNAIPFSDEMAEQIVEFVENNMQISDDVRFIIHCRYGQSRSVAVGCYVAKKINEFNDDFLSDYDYEDENGELKNQFVRISPNSGHKRHPNSLVMQKLAQTEKNRGGDSTFTNNFHEKLFAEHPNTGWNAAQAKFKK